MGLAVAMHILGIVVGGERGRFVQEYDDDAFYKLPYIRRFGCVPSEMLAWHLEAGEDIETSERVKQISRLPVAYYIDRPADAEQVLLAYEEERLAAERLSASADETAREQQTASLQETKS